MNPAERLWREGQRQMWLAHQHEKTMSPGEYQERRRIGRFLVAVAGQIDPSLADPIEE